MEAVRLHFPEPGSQVLRLAEGSYGIGRRNGHLGMVSEKADALIRLNIDRRGIWMNVSGKTVCVHLNGRRIHRIALLRSGDVFHIDNIKLRLTSPPRPLPAQIQALPQTVEPHPGLVLRALGGPDHGRCFPLNRQFLAGRSPKANVQLDDPSCGEHHAWLERFQDGVLLRHPAISGRSLVNGLPLHEAILMAGDQVAFSPRHRFVIETSDSPTQYSPATTPATSPPPPPLPSRSLRPLIWLLVAAVLLAALLAGVLLFGSAQDAQDLIPARAWPKRPPLTPALDQRQFRLLPTTDTAIKHKYPLKSGLFQAFGRSRGNHSSLAHQHHRQ